MLRAGQTPPEAVQTRMQAEIDLAGIAAERRLVEEEIRSRLHQAEQLRVDNDNVRRDVAELQAKIAVLEERRSSIVRELNLLRQSAGELDDRSKRAERQIQLAHEQQDQTQAMIQNLEESRFELERERQLGTRN